jgi:uncharacterized protein YyaL (SSP411 family)
VVDWKFTYNNGIMLQAACMLAEATQNTSYLDYADELAEV